MLSRMDISLEKRVVILPIGFESKKIILALMTISFILSCRLVLADSMNKVKK